MAFKPFYPKLDEIPETQREHYRLNTTTNRYEIDDPDNAIAALLNPGLEKNRNAIKGEKEQAVTEAQRLSGEVTRLQGEVSRVNQANQTEIQRLGGEVQRLTAELQKSTTPGSVAMSKEDAEAFEKYKALGKPDELATVKTERDDLKTKVESQTRDGQIRSAADNLDWQFSVLKSILTHPDNAGVVLSFEKVTEEGNDEKVERPHLTYKDADKDKKVLLTEFVTEKASAFLPALEASSDNGGEPDENEKTRKTGTRFPAQTRTDRTRPAGGGKTDAVDSIVADFQKSRDDAPNPLAPRKQQSASA